MSELVKAEKSHKKCRVRFKPMTSHHTAHNANHYTTTASIIRVVLCGVCIWRFQYSIIYIYILEPPHYDLCYDSPHSLPQVVS